MQYLDPVRKSWDVLFQKLLESLFAYNCCMKFRVIQSNDRGLITKVGDRTFFSRKPKKGEENLSSPTLFIWVKKPKRLVARCWTRWTGETLKDDFIYEVTKFRDLIDITGENHFHQWSSQFLRLQLWEIKAKNLNMRNFCCPSPEEVWEGKRNKRSIYFNRRKQRMISQTPELSGEELKKIERVYEKRNSLNFKAGFIKYHVDHIKPLSQGGSHEYENLRIVTADINLKKGSKLIN